MVEEDIPLFNIQQNNGSFSIKRQVTFHKTTGHFSKTTGWFGKLTGRFLVDAKRCRRRRRRKNRIVKIRVITGSRACACTRTLQEFLCFCYHKCHSRCINTYISEACLIYKEVLTNNGESIPQTRPTTSENTDFRANFRVFFSIFPSFFLHFLSLFSLFSPKCDTCDSKKTTLRLECAPTRVREKRSPNFLPLLFSSFSLLPLSCFLGSFFFPFLPVFPPSFFFFPASFAPSPFPFFSSGGVIQNPKTLILLFLHCKSVIIQRKNALF